MVIIIIIIITVVIVVVVNDVNGSHGGATEKVTCKDEWMGGGEREHTVSSAFSTPVSTCGMCRCGSSSMAKVSISCSRTI